MNPRRTSRTRQPGSAARPPSRLVRGPRIAAVALAAAACSSSTGPGEVGSLSVSFRAVDAGGASASLTGPPSTSLAASIAPVVVEGSNGTLTIDEVWLIVDELKLEGDASACEEEGTGQDPDDDAEEPCGKFEAPPHLLSLRLDVPGEEEEEIAASETVLGQFHFVKFEVKEPRDHAGLQEQLATQFGDEWPGDAAGLIVGSFTDGQGTTPFRAFFAGEVRVELEFDVGLSMAEDAEAEVVVLLDPAAWFTNPDGTATNLALHDWDATQQVFDLEVKILDGFTKIEVE